MPKRANNAERKHLDRVAGLPCGRCYMAGDWQIGKTFVHHIRTGQGMSQRASHFLTVPLCADCHQGDQGIHGDRTLWKIAKVDEMDVLAWTIEQLTRKSS